MPQVQISRSFFVLFLFLKSAKCLRISIHGRDVVCQVLLGVLTLFFFNPIHIFFSFLSFLLLSSASHVFPSFFLSFKKNPTSVRSRGHFSPFFDKSRLFSSVLLCKKKKREEEEEEEEDEIRDSIEVRVAESGETREGEEGIRKWG